MRNFSNPMLITALSIAGFLGVKTSVEAPKDMRKWLLEMHAAQVELLKIDWGQPGFCTEWDRDYNPRKGSCGKRGKLTERRYSR